MIELPESEFERGALGTPDPVVLRLVCLVSFGFPALITDRFQLREFRSIDYLLRIPKELDLNPIEAKNAENEAASGPDKIATPYFSKATITNIYSNNIVLTRSLRVLSEFPIFGADRTLVAGRYWMVYRCL